MVDNIVEEIVIKGNNIIRIYSIEEWKEYFNSKKYLSMEELIKANLMQRQRKVIKNKMKRN